MAKLKHSEMQDWLHFRYNFLALYLTLYHALDCFYCGRKDLLITGKQKQVATIDHVFPLSRGGNRYDTTNIVIACDRCNRKKGSMTITEWLQASGTSYLINKQRTQKTQGYVVTV